MGKQHESNTVCCRVPSLLESTLRPSFGSGPMLQIYITGYNTLFLFVLSAVLYGVVCAPSVMRWACVPQLHDAMTAQTLLMTA